MSKFSIFTVGLQVKKSERIRTKDPLSGKQLGKKVSSGQHFKKMIS